jgi:hypothetical protein
VDANGVYLGCSGYAGKGRPHVAECVRLEMSTSHYLQWTTCDNDFQNARMDVYISPHADSVLRKLHLDVK